MAEPEMEKKTSSSSSSSMTLDSSLLSDFVSKSAKMAQPTTKEQALLKADWSLLPEDLLQLILTYIENQNCCFFADVIHVRSVCRSWRSAIHSPYLNRSYTLPGIIEYFIDGWLHSCTLMKFPLFLFRVKTQSPLESPPPSSEYFLGGIVQEDHHTKVSSTLQCSVKVNFPRCIPILMNMLDCEILPLGYRYGLIGPYDEETKRGIAFLPLNKEEDEFVVLLNTFGNLFVLTSSEMRWTRIDRLSRALCKDVVTFRGKFYAIFQNGDVFVIDPYNPMEMIPITLHDLHFYNYLVPSDDDQELLLVDKISSATIIGEWPNFNRIPDYNRLPCRVSKLDEETGEWIVVSDVGDRVLIIGKLGNVAFSHKHLPDGCGLSGNSILFTEVRDGNVTSAYKYGVGTENLEYDFGLWGFSGENCVSIRNESPSMLAFRVNRILDT